MAPVVRQASAKVAPYEERFQYYMSNPIEGNMSFHEMADFVRQQDWFASVRFENRAGCGFMGGGMLGITTVLAHVFDKMGRQVGESMGKREAAPLARFLDAKYPNMAPHTVKVV